MTVKTNRISRTRMQRSADGLAAILRDTLSGGAQISGGDHMLAEKWTGRASAA
jgi:hypothetical protein